MAQLEGLKTASTMATYADLGLGGCTEALNKAGLLDAYVVACKTAPVLQGAGTALSVLDGVRRSMTISKLAPISLSSKVSLTTPRR